MYKVELKQLTCNQGILPSLCLIEKIPGLDALVIPKEPRKLGIQSASFAIYTDRDSKKVSFPVYIEHDYNRTANTTTA